MIELRIGPMTKTTTWSKIWHFILATLWIPITTVIGLICGILGGLGAAFGRAMGYIGTQAPPGWVWISSGTETPTWAWFAAAILMLMGAFFGFIIYHAIAQGIRQRKHTTFAVGFGYVVATSTLIAAIVLIVIFWVSPGNPSPYPSEFISPHWP
jgi:hypothetical protein